MLLIPLPKELKNQPELAVVLLSPLQMGTNCQVWMPWIAPTLRNGLTIAKSLPLATGAVSAVTTRTKIRCRGWQMRSV